MVTRAMKIFRKRQEHVRLDTLSAHLDGMTSATEQEYVEHHLAGCDSCREELESLRQTVGLLRRVPVESPRRSFILAEAPWAPADPKPWRMPAWGYVAATSAAALVFAVLLSADLTGSLAGDAAVPDPSGSAAQTSAPVSSTASALEPAGEQEAEVEEAIAKDGELEVMNERAVAAAPAPPDVSSATATEKQVVETTEVEREVVLEMEAVAEQAAEPGVAPEVAVSEAAERPAPAEASARAVSDQEPPLPLDAQEQLDTSALDGAEAEAAPTSVPQPAAQAPEVMLPDGATPLSEAPVAAESEVSDVLPPEVPAAEDADPALEATEGPTATLWRVAEGVFAGIAVVLAAFLLRRLWRSRRPAC